MLLTILMALKPLSNESTVVMMNREFALNYVRMAVCALNVNNGMRVGMENTNIIVLFLKVRLLFSMFSELVRINNRYRGQKVTSIGIKIRDAIVSRP